MQTISKFIIFSILLVIISPSNAVYRVRKYINSRVHDAQRRSPTDDALDLAAAEEIFKETQKGKSSPISKSFQQSGHLPFGTEEDWDDDDKPKTTSVGAPGAQPTNEQLSESTTVENGGTHTDSLELPDSQSGEKIDFTDIEKSYPVVTTPSESETTTKAVEEAEEVEEEPSTVSPFINDGQTGKMNVGEKPSQSSNPAHGNIRPYDYNISPEFAVVAPYARGLVGIPDGWNTDKTVDEEFKSGYRTIDFRRRFWS